MTDIVERLRKWSVFGYGYEASCDMKEAATAIEAQRANMANAARLLSEQTDEIDRLRAALRDLITHTCDCERELTEDLYHAECCGESLPLTKARAALGEK